MHKHFIRAILMIISIVFGAYVSLTLWNQSYISYLPILWLSSIMLLIISFVPDVKINPDHIIEKIRKNILIIALLLLPIVVRVINYSPFRIHGDDLLTAYFSLHYRPLTINFFSGLPSFIGDWVCQFPVLYFLIQKVILRIIGESIITVKISVLPYVFITTLMLYLISKQIFNKTVAILAVILYSFFSISLYLETLGLHFISSTAVFLIFFYYLIKAYRNNQRLDWIITGVTSGLCYLFYSSSYIAFSILIVIAGLAVIKFHNKNIIYNIGLTLCGFLLTSGPFFIYALRTNNYFLQRINQVSLFTGEWSYAKNDIKNGASPNIFLKENTIKSLQSLVINNIGGHGGYTFNQQAFFDYSMLTLFILGTIISLFYIRKKTDLIFIYLCILISFITGVVLTIPPPAYHRLSLVFPFIAVISSLPVYMIMKIKYIPKIITLVVSIVILIFVAINNLLYFKASINPELYYSNLKLAQFINTNYPNRHIHVAYYPSFAFEKIYYFSPGKNALSIDTQYHDHYLKNSNTNEPYVYIIYMPDAFSEQFSKLDPKGKLIKYSSDCSLLVN